MPYEDDEQEDDNDTNITDDEAYVDIGVRIQFNAWNRMNWKLIFFLFFSSANRQNHYYQKLGIDEKTDATTNSSRLKLLLETQEVANDMKNLLITNPNTVADAADTTKPNDVKPTDVKPNVSATSSSPPTVQSKSEQ